MKDLKEINGNEIIKFLNDYIKDDNNEEDLDDVCVGLPIIFEDQKILENEYRLTFTGYFNNWSADQEICGNEIRIQKDGTVSAYLEEPFDCDSSGDTIEEILSKWLENHTFETNLENKFDEIIKKSIQDLNSVEYKDKNKLEIIINQLIEAKTYIK